MLGGVASGTSMLGSIFSGITHTITHIVDVLSHLENVIITAFQYMFAAFLYTIQIGFFWLIDMIQSVFRRVAGLDVYWYRQDNGAVTQQEGDIVESFLRSDTVWTVFISVLIASIILLFVTTMIAILKTELNEKDNAKGPVIKQALKAIAYFVIVPVVCIFGVTLANIFLRSFDSATALDGATSISGQVFAAAAYDCNRVRDGHRLAGDDKEYTDAVDRLMGVTYTSGGNSRQRLKISHSSSRGEIANAIDEAFVKGYTITDSSKVIKYEYSLSSYMAGYSVIFGGDSESFATYDKTATSLVYYYYDLLKYNYLIGYIASGTIVMLLLNLMIGVVQRLFDLTILFIVSPAFIAAMPLDDGSRYKKWKDQFIAKTLACYGPIIGINLAFTILTLVQRIYIFDPDGGGLNGLFNALMQCIFVITAILCVKDFGKLINGLVGGDDITNNKAGDVKKLGSKTLAAGAQAGLAGVKLGAAAANTGGRLVKAGVDHHRAAKAMKNLDKTVGKKAYEDMDAVDKNAEAEIDKIKKSTMTEREKRHEIDAVNAMRAARKQAIAKPYLDAYKSLEDKKSASWKDAGGALANGFKRSTKASVGGLEGIRDAFELKNLTKDFTDAGGTKALEDTAESMGNSVQNTIRSIGTTFSLDRSGFRVIDQDTKNPDGSLAGYNARDGLKKIRGFLGTGGQAKKDKEKKDAADAQAAQAKANAEAMENSIKELAAALKEIESKMPK